MNKYQLPIFLLIGTAIVSLTGCNTSGYAGGDTKTVPAASAASTSVIAAEKLVSEKDQLVLDYFSLFINAEKGKEGQTQFINDKIASKSQFAMTMDQIFSGSEGKKVTEIQIMESIDGHEGGSFVTLTLADYRVNQKTAETIFSISNRKILSIITSEQKEFAELRAAFKTPLPKEIADAQAAEKAVPKLEILQKSSKAWKNSINSVYVHSAVVLKNTGEAPVKVSSLQFNFEDQDGGVLGTEKMLLAYPDILMPGETAFVGETSLLEGAKSPKEFKETSINFSFDKTKKNYKMLEVSGVKGKAFDGFMGNYKVTGFVKNQTTEIQKNISLAAGLFDVEGNILGVVTSIVSVGINPGSQAGFEIRSPEIPESVIGKIATIEVKAFSL